MNGVVVDLKTRRELAEVGRGGHVCFFVARLQPPERLCTYALPCGTAVCSQTSMTALTEGWAWGWDLGAWRRVSGLGVRHVRFEDGIGIPMQYR